MPSRVTQGKKKYCMILLICEILKIGLLKAGSTMLVTRNHRENWGDVGQSPQNFSYIGEISSRDTM